MKPIKLLPPFDINYKMMSLAETKNYGHSLHNIPEAWLESKGEGIVIGVIDTGLPIHRDLDDQITKAVNFTKDPLPDNVQGHSTFCSGLLCAKENNEGIVGIAPKAKIIIAKALDNSGSGDDESIAKSINWCAENGANIINMSLGAPANYEHLFPETKEAIKRAYKEGIVIVCASGNEDASKVGFPARMEQCIAVGAVDSKKQRASFSNRGPELDFAAAGVNILSTFKNNSYGSLSGTSFSAPQVTGIAALILSSHKDTNKETPITFPPKDIYNHLKKICLDVGPTGWDQEYGFGLPIYGQAGKLPIEPPKKSFFSNILDFFKGWF